MISKGPWTAHTYLCILSTRPALTAPAASTAEGEDEAKDKAKNEAEDAPAAEGNADAKDVAQPPQCNNRTE